MYKVYRPVVMITMLVLIASLALGACGANAQMSGSAGQNFAPVQPGVQPGAQPGVVPDSATPISPTAIAVIVAVLILAILAFAMVRGRKPAK